MNDFVRLEPEVIEEILRICDVMLRELEESANTATRLGRAEGFGDLESAKQLAAGFARKGAGTPESAVERVDQFIAALSKLRDAFASGGEAFLDTEFEWARQLSDTGPEL